MTDPAGWKPDPTGRHEHRYWDGAGWTDLVADGGAPAKDPLRLADRSGPAAAPPARPPAAPRAPEPRPSPASPSPQSPSSPAAERDAYTGWARTPDHEPAATSSWVPRSAPEPAREAPVGAAPPVPRPAPAPSAPRPSAAAPSRPQHRSRPRPSVPPRALLVGGAVVVVLLVGWLALRGGGGSSQDAETERRLAKVIAGTGVVTRQQADCIAEEIVDRVGSDELSQIDDLTQMPDDLSQEFVDALTAAQAQALDACGAAGAGTGG